MTLDQAAWMSQLREAADEFLTIYMRPDVTSKIKQKAIRDVEWLIELAKADVVKS